MLFEHINFHGSYPFNRPDLGGELRDLRDPDPAGPQGEEEAYEAATAR